MSLPVPYPADVRAKGWRFELDHERIRKSDTWALAPAEVRPWLLMLWMTAWEQSPCGSLPNSDELIAAHIGMPDKTFAKHKERLMRGWWLAEDGRLYHGTLVERVTEMLSAKDKERTRKAEYRRRMDAERAAASQGDPNLSHGTDTGQSQDSHGSDPGRDDTGTGTGTGTKKDSVPNGTDAAGVAALTKAELWTAGKSLLESQGMPKAQCGSFVGKLVKDYTDAIVIDAVRATVVARPADAAEYLVATCKHAAGERQHKNGSVIGVTVPGREGPDPALAKIEADRLRAAPIPENIRQQLQSLRGNGVPA